MKPSRGRVFCRECSRPKLLFDSEKKADLFIKFNADEIKECNRYAPDRSYYCIVCGGWHVTHKPFDSAMKSVSERVVEEYNNYVKSKESMRQKVMGKRHEIHKTNLEHISEISVSIEKIYGYIESGLHDEAETALLEAYKMLQSIWTAVGDKATKKKIHKRLDYLAETLKIKPIKING